MKILIIEDEIYLAQSISGKLMDSGHECDRVATVKEATKRFAQHDVLLLSASLSGQDILPLIRKAKEKIIILMVAYISNDTVTIPLNEGAADYILKPFMIEELERKINHYSEFKQLQQGNALFDDFKTHLFKDIASPKAEVENLPILIKTNYQRSADAYAFKIADASKRILTYLPLNRNGVLKKAEALKSDKLCYMPELQSLKKGEKETLFRLVADKQVIISTTDKHEQVPFMELELISDHKIFDRTEILMIDDYVKFIIVNYQSKYPDTELSKKLGISRKSLWEKRKRYGIFKKK